MSVNLKKIRRTADTGITHLKPKVLQFGEGNFLRGFVDWMIYKMNKHAGFDASVKVIQPIRSGVAEKLEEQEGLYTLVLNGHKNGQFESHSEIINVVDSAINPYTSYNRFLLQAENPDLKFIVSNTTEAGIQFNPTDKLEDKPPKTFPGKLTQLLFRRFERWPNGTKIFILPCELVDKNGDQLKRCIEQYIEHWELGQTFSNWLQSACIFYNTLVDRIVPGYPSENAKELWKKWGYIDELIVEGELFHLWVIEGPLKIKDHFPAETAGLKVVFTENELSRYRERKVRILNGSHSSLVPIGYLSGFETVGDAVSDELLQQFIERLIFEEIIPTLAGNKEELNQYGRDTINRFRNPAIRHELMSIALNSISKFKTRVLPSILAYQQKMNETPDALTFAFAALIKFYEGFHDGNEILLNDEEAVLLGFRKTWSAYRRDEIGLDQLVYVVLSKTEWWEEDLSQNEELFNAVKTYLMEIEQNGIVPVAQNLLVASS